MWPANTNSGTHSKHGWQPRNISHLVPPGTANQGYAAVKSPRVHDTARTEVGIGKDLTPSLSDQTRRKMKTLRATTVIESTGVHIVLGNQLLSVAVIDS